MTSPHDPPTEPCPDVRELARLADGQTPGEDVESLVRHLETCDHCLETLAGLPQEDPLARTLAGLSRVPSNPEQDDLDRVVERLQQHLQEWAPGGSPRDLLPADTDATTELAEPRWVRHYRLLDRLGAGGMGVVYRAEDTHLARPVALKVMRPELARDVAARQRFLHEARAMAAVRTDHVVHVYQVGEDDAVPFLAMELLDGATLEKRLGRGGRPDLAEVLRIGREAAEGLAVLHAHGLIHRDVKPSNIFLSTAGGPPGKVKLLDFGLARPAQRATPLTGSGVIVGTPHYLAPEQARGDNIDERADVYGLGVVLYQMSTGVLPLGDGVNDVLAVLTALAVETPRPVDERNPALPAPFRDLVMRMLAKRPEQRPSAREVVETLRSLEESQPVVGGPAWWNKRFLLLLAAAVVVVLAGVLLIRIKRPDGSEMVLEAPKGSTVTVTEKADSAPAQTLPLLPAYFHFLRFSGDGRRMVTASVTDDAVRVAVWDFPSLRLRTRLGGWSPGSHSLQDIGKRVKYQVLNGDFSADGRRLALAVSGPGKPEFALWDLETPDRPRILTHDHCAIHALAFRPDGKVLATGSANVNAPQARTHTIKLWDTATGESIQELAGMEGFQTWVNALAFAPDGRRLFAGYLNYPRLVAWDLAAATRQDVGEPLGSSFVRPGMTVAADGRRIAFPTKNYTVRVLDVTTDATLFQAITSADAYWGFALSADGRRLAVPDKGDETVTVWDVDTRGRVATVRPPVPAPCVRALALSPDGRRLVTVGTDGVAQMYDLPQ